MATASNYQVLFYGGPDGYQTNRAQIYLSDAAGKPLAYLRFNDPERTTEHPRLSGRARIPRDNGGTRGRR